MKLQDLNASPVTVAEKALDQHFNIKLSVSKLSLSETKTLRAKVKGYINETKKTGEYYSSQQRPAILKLLFMEQALSAHHAALSKNRFSKIIVENEEVERSQVVLATQDLVDSVQKMLETVSDVTVKELPALIDKIQSEIGVNESDLFSQQVTQTLSTLTAALTQAKAEMQSALNIVTGQESPDMGAETPEVEPAQDEMDDPAELPDVDAEAPLELGRPKR